MTKDKFEHEKAMQDLRHDLQMRRRLFYGVPLWLQILLPILCLALLTLCVICSIIK